MRKSAEGLSDLLGLTNDIFIPSSYYLRAHALTRPTAISLAPRNLSTPPATPPRRMYRRCIRRSFSSHTSTFTRHTRPSGSQGFYFIPAPCTRVHTSVLYRGRTISVHFWSSGIIIDVTGRFASPRYLPLASAPPSAYMSMGFPPGCRLPDVPPVLLEPPLLPTHVHQPHYQLKVLPALSARALSRIQTPTWPRHLAD